MEAPKKMEKIRKGKRGEGGGKRKGVEKEEGMAGEDKEKEGGREERATG